MAEISNCRCGRPSIPDSVRGLCEWCHRAFQEGHKAGYSADQEHEPGCEAMASCFCGTGLNK